MKRTITFVLVALFSFHSTPVAHAELEVAQCFELKYPDSYLSSNTLTLSANVYALCDKTSLGRGDGQKPIYSLVEQLDLNLSGCPGPAITQLAGNGLLGKVTCTIRVGDSPLASSRIGASSTTIKAWLAWDFSSKTVTVNHSPIPGPTKPKVSLPIAPVPTTANPTPSPIVESQEIIVALKETQEAIDNVEAANRIALAAEKSSIITLAKLSSLTNLMESLMTELRERIKLSIVVLEKFVARKEIKGK